MREKCYQCFRPKSSCLCKFVKRFDTKTKFVILIHPMEAKRERLGTGRLVHYTLKNSVLIMGINFTDDNQVNHYLDTEKYNPLIMYPGDNAIKVSDLAATYGANPSENGKETIIFILDGTWPSAKKMMRESVNLHTIPRITIDINKPSNFRIKQQPHELCLSTLEAVVQFLDECEEHKVESLNKKHHTLLDGLEGMVEFQEKCAKDPNLKSYRKGSYKPPEERIPSKKWESYCVFYRGD